MPNTPHEYHDGNRHFQDRFDSRRLADRAAEVRIADRIEDWAIEPITQANFFFLATCDHRGLPTCSYKGGDRGFVKILDARTLAFPSYDGNGQFLSMGNLLKNPNLGMLFVNFEEPGRLRVQGEAEIRDDDELLAEYPGAQLVVRVHAREVFRNCPRYVHRFTFDGTSVYVPGLAYTPPAPDWKYLPELNPYLPAHDPALGQRKPDA